MGCVASTTFIYTEGVLPTSLGLRWEARVGEPISPHHDLLALVVSGGFPLRIFDLESMQMESTDPGQDKPLQLPVLPPQGVPTLVLFLSSISDLLIRLTSINLQGL